MCSAENHFNTTVQRSTANDLKFLKNEAGLGLFNGGVQITGSNGPRKVIGYYNDLDPKTMEQADQLKAAVIARALFLIRGRWSEFSRLPTYPSGFAGKGISFG